VNDLDVIDGYFVVELNLGSDSKHSRLILEREAL
jgi:hypothetical protein